MEVFGLAAMVALIWKVVDFLKYVTSREWRPALTQAIVWAAGVGVVGLFATSNATKSIAIGGQALGGLDLSGIVIAGFGLASVSSALVDFKKARDSTDSAAVPPLGGDIAA